MIGLYLYGHSQKRTSSALETRPAEPAADRLKNLQKLLDEGLITQEEYQARRAATIESL